MLGIQLENAIVAELETDTEHDEDFIGWVDGECAWLDTKEGRWRIESLEELNAARCFGLTDPNLELENDDERDETAF